MRRNNPPTLSGQPVGTCLQTLSGHENPITAMAVLPNGDVASGSKDGTIKIGRLENGRYTGVQTLKGHTDNITSLARLPNGDVASGSKDGTVKIWRPTENEEYTCVQTLRHEGVPLEGIRCLTVLATGELVSGASEAPRDTLKFWRLENGQYICRQAFHIQDLGCLQALPNGDLALGSNLNDSLEFWRPEKGNYICVQTVRDFAGPRSFAILPNGLLASTSFDRIKLWRRSPTGEYICVQTLSRESRSLATLTTLTMLPNGLLASGWKDGTIGLWELENENCISLQIWKGHQGGVTSLRGLPNGSLASGGEDGTIRVWEAGTPSLRSQPADLKDQKEHKTLIDTRGEEGEARETIPSNDSFTSHWEATPRPMISTTSSTFEVALWKIFPDPDRAEGAKARLDQSLAEAIQKASSDPRRLHRLGLLTQIKIQLHIQPHETVLMIGPLSENMKLKKEFLYAIQEIRRNAGKGNLISSAAATPQAPAPFSTSSLPQLCSAAPGGSIIPANHPPSSGGGEPGNTPSHARGLDELADEGGVVTQHPISPSASSSSAQIPATPADSPATASSIRTAPHATLLRSGELGTNNLSRPSNLKEILNKVVPITTQPPIPPSASSSSAQIPATPADSPATASSIRTAPHATLLRSGESGLRNSPRRPGLNESAHQSPMVTPSQPPDDGKNNSQKNAPKGCCGGCSLQ